MVDSRYGWLLKRRHIAMLSNRNCAVLYLVKRENFHPEPHGLFSIEDLVGKKVILKTERERERERWFFEFEFELNPDFEWVWVFLIFGRVHHFKKCQFAASWSYCHNNSATQTRFLFRYNVRVEQRLSFKLSLQAKPAPVKFSLDQDFIKERDLTNHLANIFRRPKYDFGIAPYVYFI